MKISFLADHPQFIETLAPWVYEYWRPILTEDTLDDRIKKLHGHLNHHNLPLALVAHDGDKVFGTAALRIHDLPGREDLSPWLGGVFVGQAFRGQGIGAALCAEIEKLAAEQFNISTLYLFTLDKQVWYQDLGWSFVEPCVWLGREGDILSKAIHASKATASHN